MNKNYNRILNKLEENINSLRIEYDDSLLFYEKAIDITIQSSEELKKLISQIGFSDANEEISFFKHLKPSLINKLIYYNSNL